MTTAYQDRVGETVQHRYRLESLLGVGGFGAVYRATHVQMGTDLALKILHAEHCQDPRTVKRFELEAKRSAALKHPNTIRVFDFGATEAGEFFIAMEYLAGRSLASLIHREGPLAPERVVHILAQALRALDEAHMAGLVHRDLKPDNIFLLEIGHEHDFVKVLDFGIAKAPRTDSGMTTVGTLIGTPVYMSPEQCRGKELDGRSDLYALGCIAFECLTKRTPFEAEDPLGYALAHAQEAPPDPRDLAPPGHPIPDALAEWILRLLAKDPNNRYPDAVATLEALGHTLDEAVTSTELAAAEGDLDEEPEVPEPPPRPTLTRPTPVRTTPARPTPARPTPAQPTPARPTPARPTPARIPSGHTPPAPLETGQARLTEPPPKRPAKPWWFWAGLGTIALTAVVILLVWPREETPPDDLPREPAQVATTAPEDLGPAVTPEVVSAREADATAATDTALGANAQPPADATPADATPAARDTAALAADTRPAPDTSLATAPADAATTGATAATLRVTSVPTGARVRVDGRDLGKTPLDVPTHLGARHKLVVAAKGRITATREVELTTSDQTIEVRLEKAKPTTPPGLLDF